MTYIIVSILAVGVLLMTEVGRAIIKELLGILAVVLVIGLAIISALLLISRWQPWGAEVLESIILLMASTLTLLLVALMIHDILKNDQRT